MNSAYPGTAQDLHTVVGEIAASGSNSNRQLTTQLQMSLANSRSDVTFVGTSDLPLKSDGIHFGRDAKLTIGARFGDAFISILEQPNGIAGDVNQDGVVSGNGTGLPESDDVAAFVLGWGESTIGLTNLAKTQLGDLNLDGKTSLPDAFILHDALEAVGLNVPLGVLTGAIVPEPLSAVYASIVWAVFVVRPIRRRASLGVETKIV